MLFQIQILREKFKEPTKKRKIALTRACKSKTGSSFKQHKRPHSTSLLILSTPNSTVIATGIISNIVQITELHNEPNVALHSLKGFSGLIALNT